MKYLSIIFIIPFLIIAIPIWILTAITLGIGQYLDKEEICEFCEEDGHCARSCKNV